MFAVRFGNYAVAIVCEPYEEIGKSGLQAWVQVDLGLLGKKDAAFLGGRLNE